MTEKQFLNYRKFIRDNPGPGGCLKGLYVIEHHRPPYTHILQWRKKGLVYYYFHADSAHRHRLIEGMNALIAFEDAAQYPWSHKMGLELLLEL